MFREQSHVFGPLAQRRDVQPHDVQAVEQILAEAAGPHVVLEPAVGRRDDPHVDLPRARAADHRDGLLLHEPQQPRLHVEGQLADLVEEHGAAVGHREPAGGPLLGAGECAALVAEELRVDERGGNGAAVHDHEGLGAPATQLVQGLRQHLLAGAALAGDQHGRVGGRHAPGAHEQIGHRRRLEHDRTLLRSQVLQLGLQPPPLVLRAHAVQLGEMFAVERHGQLIGHAGEHVQVGAVHVEHRRTAHQAHRAQGATVGHERHGDDQARTRARRDGLLPYGGGRHGGRHDRALGFGDVRGVQRAWVRAVVGPLLAVEQPHARVIRHEQRGAGGMQHAA